VNKGKKDKKGRDMITQILASSKWHQVGLRKLEEPKAREHGATLPILERFTLKNAPPGESVLYLAGEPLGKDGHC
jgi:hypothetical protein